MFGIVNADANLSQAGSNWVGKATIYSLASGVAGAATGALLGTLGSWLPESGRIAVASLLGIAAAILDGGEFYYGHSRPIQCDREPPSAGSVPGRCAGRHATVPRGVLSR